MATKRRKKQSRFYEALSMAPGLPHAADKLPTDTFKHLFNRAKAWYISEKVSNVRADVMAVLHDAGLWAKRVWEQLRSAPARVIYLGVVLAVVLFGTVSAVQIAASTMHKYGRDLQNPAILMNEKNTGTTVLDRNGVVLFQGYGAVDRHNIPFEEMPSSLKQATLSVEDPDFYKHPGFSWRGTARAAYQDLMHSGKVQGGSTITQQLVKNTLLSNEKSFTRKYKEVLLSMELERRYSKDQILQMYLNTIYYGQGAYGVEAASETYFHKPAHDLTVQESALLAGLPQSPSVYDPNMSEKAAKQRRDYVLTRMQEQGYLSPADTLASKQQPIVAGTRQVVIKAPHFVFYVLDQLRQKYGQDAIEHGGITVHTTLDYTKQEQAEQIVKTRVEALAAHHATNGGLVSMDTHTGDIISMVGSVDYSEPGFGAVNVTTAQLQPGSSFKPIVYATAFTKGWNGSTIVQDKPLKLPDGTGGTYEPKNYDLKFRGPVTLRRALANSLNIPAVEVMQYAGINASLAMAHNLGVSDASLAGDSSNYGLSLVLGAGNVRPVDMVTAYSAFANQGKTVTPRAITSVQNRFGDDITKKDTTTTHQAIDARIAFMITNILSDNRARTEEFGANSPLVLSRPAAAKTGTTNDFRDNWTVGYTPDLATAVWVGNNDHTPMSNVDGITGAAPIWHDYMEMALKGTPVHDFTVPAGVVFARVCQDGGLVDGNDANSYPEVFLAEAKPTRRCGTGKSTDKPKVEQKKDNPAAPPAQQASAPAVIGRGSGNEPTPPPKETPPPDSTPPPDDSTTPPG